MDTIYWRMNATQGGGNLHTGVNLLLGANCAHEHEDSFIPLLKQITKSIMDFFLETSDHIIIHGMQIVYDICTALEYHPELIFHIFKNCMSTKIL